MFVTALRKTVLISLHAVVMTSRAQNAQAVKTFVQGRGDNAWLHSLRSDHRNRQVCQRVLSLAEANAICEHAQKVSGGQAIGHRSPPFVPLSSESSAVPGGAVSPDATTSAAIQPLLASPKAPADGADTGESGSAEGEETAVGGGIRGVPDPHGPPTGLKQYTASDGNLNEMLSNLFKQADTEKKVRRARIEILVVPFCVGAALKREAFPQPIFSLPLLCVLDVHLAIFRSEDCVCGWVSVAVGGMPSSDYCPCLHMPPCVACCRGS